MGERRLAESNKFILTIWLNHPFPTTTMADQQMADDRADMILEIPLNFERNLLREGTAARSFNANAINATKATMGMGYASNIIRDFNTEFSEKWTPRHASQEAIPINYAAAQPINVTYSNGYIPRLDYKTFMVPGILCGLFTPVTSMPD